MPLNRLPTATQVNGSALLVKDPDQTAGLFSKYQRVPGLASFTLPDETGSTTATQLMDGSVEFAQIAGVGTITGALGSISGHATHTLLAEKRRSGGSVTVAIVRPAILIGDALGVIDGEIAVAAHGGAGFSVVTVTGSAGMAIAKNLIREGRLVLIKGSAPASTDSWHGVLKVNDDGGKFSIDPGVVSPISKTSGTGLYVRQAGYVLSDVICTVNGFGDGDFQAGSAIAANLSLSPSEALPVRTRDPRLLAGMATAFDAALAEIA